MSLDRIDQYMRELNAVRNYDKVVNLLSSVHADYMRYVKLTDDFVDFIRNNRIMDSTVEKKFAEFEANFKKEAENFRKVHQVNISFLQSKMVDEG